MKGLAMVIALPILGSVLAIGLLAAVGRGRRVLAPPDGPEISRRTTAEVVSVLLTRDRRFLRVRYRLGTSMIETDLLYARGGAMPLVGDRVAIKYDLMAPARVALDAGTPGDVPRPPGSGLPRSERADPSGTGETVVG